MKGWKSTKNGACDQCFTHDAFSGHAALCHTQKHAYQGLNMYFLCSLAYGFYALNVQFHYCKSVMSLSNFICLLRYSIV